MDDEEGELCCEGVSEDSFVICVLCVVVMGRDSMGQQDSMLRRDGDRMTGIQDLGQSVLRQGVCDVSQKLELG